MRKDPKLIQVLESLRDATEQGRIHWLETRFMTDTFETKVANNRFLVQLHLDDDSFHHSITIQGGDSKTIEYEEFSETDEGHKVVEDLYRIARRNARRVDDVLDSVLAEWKSLSA